VIAASWPREDPDAERLLVVDVGARRIRDALVGQLPTFLHEGDLVVVNDAATLPASLRGRTASGSPIELRLLEPPEEAFGATRARVALLGAGDWRTRTEDRPAPPALRAGEEITLGDLRARVLASEGREAAVAFDRAGARFWSALYRAGKPVQYAHVRDELALWHVQTAFASRPWAAEQPSAGRPLTWETLLALRRRGVALARVTHAAGPSSVDGGEYDARLPRPERYDIPSETVRAIGEARAAGGRVVAVGTTVVRALEGSAMQRGGELAAGSGTTALVIGPGHRLHVVDALVSGLHEPGSSHFELLGVFAPADLLLEAHDHATRAGYLGHELGDSCLMLP
jgi:S-adenosylmethionine:tRNA ribosyltransferase-isomerase